MSVWDEVVDQDKVIATLMDAATSARDEGGGGSAMTHSWLITGPPGSGRSMVARSFAAALQCTGPTPGCGKCQACRMVMRDTHPDVTFLQSDKVIISIDEVMDLLEKAQQLPVSGRWRIIIVRQADRMQERTSNLLLKSLEEPPARTVWILCTPSPEDVLTTIRSRCRHVTLKTPSYEAVAQLLVDRHGVDHQQALKAAHLAQCHVGVANSMVVNPDVVEHRRMSLEMAAGVRSVSDAVYVAEALVWYAKNSRVPVEDRRKHRYGKSEARARTDKELYASDPEYVDKRNKYLREHGVEGNPADVPQALRSTVKSFAADYVRRTTRSERDVLDRILQDLLSLYRDVYSVQVGSGAQLINIDLEAMVNDLARQSTAQATVARMDVISDTRRRLQTNVATQLLLEAMLIALRPQNARPFLAYNSLKAL